ncbi:general secretion pathway protein K [Prosthecobacter debontii]|uniref:General secretion pathway protein K n=1 Tax=Prosthecobacter debontii TaxID=48467 RepID=A0A1T4YG56_9BACT|nr:type II secretion system protein GspK [Prosthecobacter debontii]SKB00693.1 general secretion pathway protein K [Prosthecobacter debontii]
MRLPPLHRRRQQGSALVAVFWMIAVLGLVVYAGAKALEADTQYARQMRGRTYAKRLAQMGLEIGRHPALPEHDPLLHHVSPDGGSYQVRLVAEEARLNINQLLAADDKVLLPRLFASWGLKPEFAAALRDALKDWVDGDDKTSLNGAERRDYEKAGLQGMPFNRPFKEIEEMLMVRGMSQLNQIRPDWREWFTVYGDGRVDVNDARPELIALLGNVPVERVQPLLTLRAGRDGVLHSQDDVKLSSVPQVAQLLGVFQPLIVEQLTQWIQFSGPIRRIESTGQFGDIRRRLILITQNQQALWRGEIPLHGQDS